MAVINQVSIILRYSHLTKFVQLKEETVLTMKGYFLLLYPNLGGITNSRGIIN